MADQDSLVTGSGDTEMREIDANEVWLLIAAAAIALLFFIGMLMPGGIGSA